MYIAKNTVCSHSSSKGKGVRSYAIRSVPGMS